MGNRPGTVTKLKYIFTDAVPAENVATKQDLWLG
jgi:hypothetical protein